VLAEPPKGVRLPAERHRHEEHVELGRGQGLVRHAVDRSLGTEDLPALAAAVWPFSSDRDRS
jgi:hypothetical protein